MGTGSGVMALSARLNLRQSQSMVMTPQLLQSIRLLQFTHVELDRFIDEQIEGNPLLERAGAGPAVDADGAAAGADPPPATEAGSNVATTAEEIADRLDTSLENLFPDDPGRIEAPPAPVADRGSSAPMPNMAAASDNDWTPDDLPDSGASLRDVIGEQIAFALPDPGDRMIAAELTDRLDERGYLDADPGIVAERLGAPAERGARVLGVLQGFDPPGVFARDLAECLALQCARRDRLDPAMRALLDNLDLLARRDFDQLTRLCAVDEGDLLDMLAEIRTLDPRPGLAFETGAVQAVVHDVVVGEAADGGWHVELNADALPRVLVDRDYHTTVTAGELDEHERAFMTRCLHDANWLERSLDQRANTILKVAGEIVRQQDAFFVHGVSRLRPLTMKEVADAVAMHESTISRVAANKYMLTPQGLFEFRYFFSGAIAATAGAMPAHSAESVRQRIRELIDREPAEKVLSDDALVSRLQGEGIDIARRTVAKYREAMNIASSVQRRREKRARALAGA